MGNTHTVKHDKIVFVTAEGAVGLTHEFVQQYVKYMPFEVKQPVLTPRHVALIQMNWAAIAKGTSAFDPAKHGSPDKFFHRTYYGLLFAVMPSCRAIFRSSMHLQGKSLSSVIRAMTSVMHAGDIVERMQALATRHLAYGCEKVDYTTAGVTLMKTLEIVSGDRWTWEIKEAYLTAFCFLLYLMLPVIVHQKPDSVSTSIPATITAIHAAPHHSPHHVSKRVTLTHRFPLRFLPGDGIILGIPDPSTESGERRSYFPIASFRPHASHTLDIFVDESSPEWLVHQAVVGSTLKLYWVESNEHLEVDTPASIPHDLLFLSYGVSGAAPIVAMLQGMHSIRGNNGSPRGTNIVALHCEHTAKSAEATLRLATNMQDLSHWNDCAIHCGTAVSAAKLLAIVPNPEARELYVCGPAEFVAEAREAFRLAGGDVSRIHVSHYDNNKLNRAYHEASSRGLEPRFNLQKRKVSTTTAMAH
ncbi:Aste57867_22752 [Aphanomyces stellatus]|uniref:Aste57867_22752 protein n=1 Tax=Aphanomyces stellatus TaxID=120398 RepID=A0A485LLG5_9STRA|nr:hypothetical protein As57867_022682 [Aphanomyces stellatus]VFT99405.1 Aste57867_22752 [Aphanomyces stellatus]